MKSKKSKEEKSNSIFPKTWSPFAGMSSPRPLYDLQNEINSLFNGFGFGRMSELMNGDNTHWPSVDITECEDEYIIKVELAGIKKKDVRVSVKDNALEISGQRREEKNSKDTGEHFSEINYGSFYRLIPFNKVIKESEIKAKMKDGILNINVAKEEVDTSHDDKVKEIEIH